MKNINMSIMRDSLPKPTNPIFHRNLPILTGSRIFGTPGPDSDLDLVIFMPLEDAKRLVGMAEGQDPDNLQSYGDGMYSLKFGLLNLLVCTTEKAYHIMRTGTDQAIELAKEQPLTKAQSHDLFQYIEKNFDSDPADE